MDQNLLAKLSVITPEEQEMWNSRLAAAQRSPVNVRKDRMKRVLNSLSTYTSNR